MYWVFVIWNLLQNKDWKHSIEPINCSGFLLRMWYCCLLSGVPFNFCHKNWAFDKNAIESCEKIILVYFLFHCIKSNDVLCSLHFPAAALPPIVQSNMKQTMRIEIIKLLCHFILLHHEQWKYHLWHQKIPPFLKNVKESRVAVSYCWLWYNSSFVCS